ncbi:MAG TPA: type II toxin-antitoxin system RelE/ParE family toxin [Xanthobacteraceae bacterium]
MQLRYLLHGTKSSSSNPRSGKHCTAVNYGLHCRTVKVRRTAEFDNWLRRLRDERAKARIASRIQRIAFGNLGDCKSLGGGLTEMRVDYGPGYRIYFIEQGPDVVILLCGGDKRQQQRDIRRARELTRQNDDQDSTL